LVGSIKNPFLLDSSKDCRIMKLKLAESEFLRYIVFDQQRTSEGQRTCPDRICKGF
jgi:hypothetical protein